MTYRDAVKWEVAEIAAEYVHIALTRDETDIDLLVKYFYLSNNLFINHLYTKKCIHIEKKTFFLQKNNSGVKKFTFYWIINCTIELFHPL